MKQVYPRTFVIVKYVIITAILLRFTKIQKIRLFFTIKVKKNYSVIKILIKYDLPFSRATQPKFWELGQK